MSGQADVLADDDLMLLAKKGSTEAFEALVRRHHRPALRIAVRRLGCRDLAMDAVQNAFVDLYRGLDRYRAEGKFRAYFWRIVSNRCRMLHRSDGRHARLRMALAASIPPEREPLETAIIDGERLQSLRNGVMQLSPRIRSVIELRMAGLSYREIAEAIGVPTGTVKSRLFQGVASLRHLEV